MFGFQQRKPDIYHDRDFKLGDVFGPLTPRTPPTFHTNEPPAEGALLLEKVAKRYLKITRADKSFVILEWDGSPTFNRLILNEGFPEHKLEKVLNYVWNFQHAYVIKEDEEEPLFPWR